MLIFFLTPFALLHVKSKYNKVVSIIIMYRVHRYFHFLLNNLAVEEITYMFYPNNLLNSYFNLNVYTVSMRTCYSTPNLGCKDLLAQAITIFLYFLNITFSIDHNSISIEIFTWKIHFLWTLSTFFWIMLPLHEDVFLLTV